MLTAFSVSGFKSVRDEVELTLSPLTVIVGANSSGKSSLLQALLLLSQSVQLPSSDAVLDFNGLFQNLGTLQEIQSRPGSRPLRIALGFAVPESRRRILHTFETGVLPRSATYAISLSAPDDIVARTTRVDDFELRLRDGAASEAVLVAHRRRGGFPPTPHLTNSAGRATMLASQQYRVEVGLRSEGASTSQAYLLSPSASLSYGSLAAGVELAGPLPVAIWRSYDSVTRSVEAFLRDILGFGSHGGLRPKSNDAGVEKLTLDFWNEAEVRSMLGDRPSSLDDARRRVAALRPGIRTRARSLISEYVQRVSEETDPNWAFERQPLPAVFASAVDELRERLSSVYYLGPLRAAPRPLFAAAAGASPKSVGREGEFTAAVLNRYANERVEFSWEGEIVREPLTAAVGRWMQHLDLHVGAVAHDYGRLGYDLMVQDKIAGGLDLTQVGVGVSQALPVIVQCLVAPAASVIVLEQPELHLHPRVQSRLADFLIGVAKASRTVVCETHSEYLVSRLRIRTGRRQLRYGSDFRLYFTSRIDGVTRVEEVPVAGKGRLGKWPAGFFEQSAEDANELLEVQLRP